MRLGMGENRLESVYINGTLAQSCAVMEWGVMKSTLRQPMDGMGCFEKCELVE